MRHLVRLCLLSLSGLALPSCVSIADAPAAVVPSGPLSFGEHEATLNGARIWYRVAGNWDGRSAPVVFLAGGPGGNSYAFSRGTGPYLETSQLMIYYDQRGTGRSERPASGDYAIATLVKDIEALRVHLGVPKITLIAHSFAGILALEYGAQYPEKLAAAVLAGTVWNVPASCRENAERRLASVHPEAYRAMMAAGQPSELEWCERGFQALRGQERERFNEGSMFPNRAALELRNRLDAESGLRNTGELSRAVFREGLLRYQFRGGSRLTAPVLVIGGSEDFQVGPRTQAQLAGHLRRGRFLEYAGAGHWMFFDDPARFARDVSRFLREVQQRRR